MGRGNGRAELGFRGRRQAAVTDCDISLPDVRSTEIIRARELAALVYAARLSRTRTRLYMLEFPVGDTNPRRASTGPHKSHQPVAEERSDRCDPCHPWLKLRISAIRGARERSQLREPRRRIPEVVERDAHAVHDR